MGVVCFFSLWYLRVMSSPLTYESARAAISTLNPDPRIWNGTNPYMRSKAYYAQWRSDGWGWTLRWRPGRVDVLGRVDRWLLLSDDDCSFSGATYLEVLERAEAYYAKWMRGVQVLRSSLGGPKTMWDHLQGGGALGDP